MKKHFFRNGKTTTKNIQQVFIGSNTDNGLLPQDVLFVGDSVTDDILGPKAVGMKTAWIDRTGMGGDQGQDYTITDLGELKQILK